ncbi:hypothetical protein OSB04_028048 [Centaurea solstitialis]|uniref:Aminotransferase-like plant mobile domain-containing protein n=1 Tax=Centaurea solstitialis TaxID=347529 RepID=A0AA38SYI2_9ASTR|nr:hypothetical protein OSB04_028048 [Centaurea solstitialis]
MRLFLEADHKVYTLFRTRHHSEQLLDPRRDNPSNEQCMRRDRAYILVLLGDAVFPNSNDNCLHMNLLGLLEDFDRWSRLSWGSAVLACLYRNLCKASKSGEKSIADLLMLLQLSDWCRIRATRPTYVGERNAMPFGVRWNGPLTFASVPRHKISGYRKILSAITDREVS